TISVHAGRELAKLTYNPRLGIKGGISIIGTTGIVEAKSLAAYKASLALELNVLLAQGIKRPVFVLGYVGENYCKKVLKLKEDSFIKIGDHIGFMLKECAKRKIKELLLIGHIGKLVKLANGQFNTNYKFGDNRLNTIARYAKMCHANASVIKDILKQETAEATIEILKKANGMQVYKRIAQDVVRKAVEFTGNKFKLRCIILSLKGEVLAKV
ncbi:MAG TPA: cobalt-precorrin-5B (C(1))-methyltransferase CbiD, partial [Candidatus Omnitrophota bacterium]|nr:cobalt-precorrin-5B (C(1))-methyltransferase CbiD [Candidatus Omnitrophota bacterium]